MSLHKGIKLTALIAVLLLTACDQRLPDTQTANVTGLPEKALAYNPKAAQINVQLALGYLKEHDMERAKLKLLIAQRQDPGSANVKEALAFYYDRTGNVALAEKYYVEAISASSHSVGLQANNYGVFLCKQQQYDSALKYFQMAINDPKNISTAKAYENAGLCSLKIPNEVQAKQYFQAALKIDNKLPMTLLEMAKFSYQQHRYVESQHYLDRFATLAKPTADSLWLGIRLGRKLGNKDVVYSDALLLKHLYPKSTEYQQYLQTSHS